MQRINTSLLLKLLAVLAGGCLCCLEPKTSLCSHNGYFKPMRGPWEYWSWKRQSGSRTFLESTSGSGHCAGNSRSVSPGGTRLKLVLRLLFLAYDIEQQKQLRGRREQEPGYLAFNPWLAFLPHGENFLSFPRAVSHNTILCAKTPS